MIDFHTHILPGMDDGSKNSEMSVEMLKSLSDEGVTDVVLSPHFYGSQNSVERFLARRAVSAEHLQTAIESKNLGLRLHLGAEILFMDYMDKVDGLEEMAIGGTKYILLEMPFKEWTTLNLDTVYKIRSNGLTPIIAHFERYIGFQKDMKDFYELKKMGCILQMNAESFSGFFQKRKAVRFFDDGTASLLGSDCHNLESRPPKIKAAYDIIGEKLGAQAVNKIISLGSRILEKSQYIQA